jgi:magnesium chelatase family protein
MSTKLFSGQVVGLKGVPIEVEIDMVPGLHRFTIVGLPDKAVEEAKERVSAAIKNSGFRPPQKKNHRITVNLAPADLQKEGAHFDFPIALAYLKESGQITVDLDKKFFIGELALDGSLRRGRGTLPLVLAAREAGFGEIFIPQLNAEEASLVDGINCYVISTLKQAVDHLEGTELTPIPTRKERVKVSIKTDYDFSDIKGQEFAKRGVEIAAAGNHHVAFIGPPGTGKTLLARALPTILPELSFDEALEITSIHSIAGTLDSSFMQLRPYRSPHHTASYVSLVGGGTYPKPGEITLAHRGVLFMDEFPEFDRKVIESLRQPLEDRLITIARAKGSLTFPANLMLAAAMNPCPCGNKGSQKECMCSSRQLLQYARRVSGPIMDRIDIWLSMPQVEFKKLSDDSDATRPEPSSQIRARVERARNVQQERFGSSAILTNSQMGIRDLKTHCTLAREEKYILEDAAGQMDLSARAYHRVLKVSRTIADLGGSTNIKKEHLLEALQYRPRKYALT